MRPSDGDDPRVVIIAHDLGHVARAQARCGRPQNKNFVRENVITLGSPFSKTSDVNAEVNGKVWTLSSSLFLASDANMLSNPRRSVQVSKHADTIDSRGSCHSYRSHHGEI